VALRDAELLERFRPLCAGDGKGFHVELQDFTQLLRDLIRADHRTKLDDARSSAKRVPAASARAAAVIREPP
jgi:hypothetical protein